MFPLNSMIFGGSAMNSLGMGFPTGIRPQMAPSSLFSQNGSQSQTMLLFTLLSQLLSDRFDSQPTVQSQPKVVYKHVHKEVKQPSKEYQSSPAIDSYPAVDDSSDEYDTPVAEETPELPQEEPVAETPSASPPADDSEAAVILSRNVTPGGDWQSMLGSLGGFLEGVRGTYGNTVTDNLQRELSETKDTLGTNVSNLANVTVSGNRTLQIVNASGASITNLDGTSALATLYVKNDDGTTKTLGEHLAGQTVPAGWSGYGQAIDDYFKIVQGFAQDSNLSAYYKDPSTGKEYEIESIAFRDTPVILDTNGNGKMDLTDSAGGVQFDINGDGVKEQVSWTKGGEDSDSFLTLDKDGDGQITSGKELFGDQNGMANGYEELRRHDDNGDGVIDKNDAIYSSLKMWKDVNHDGTSQADELRSLADSGIESINLSATESDDTVFNNELKLKSTFTRTDDAAKALASEKGISQDDAKTGLSVDAWLEATV